MEENIYYQRIIDELLDAKTYTYGAVLLTGVKGSGKTIVALEKAKSSILLKYSDDDEKNRITEELNPHFLLKGTKPRLIAECQEKSKLWEIIGSSLENTDLKRQYIVTSSCKEELEKPWLYEIKMYPLSLYESAESNGSVSLIELFTGIDCLEKRCEASLSLDDLVFATCRGGWPESLAENDKAKQIRYVETYLKNIPSPKLIKENQVVDQEIMKKVLESYDYERFTFSKGKLNNDLLNKYIKVLEDLYIVEEIPLWGKEDNKTTKKYMFVDPSLVTAIFHKTPDYLRLNLSDYETIFKSLVLRDLKVYANIYGGKIFYLENDEQISFVLTLDSGKAAIVSSTLGPNGIEEEAEKLNKLHEKIKKDLKNGYPKLSEFKMLITSTNYGYQRDDEVFVVPIGCLKD